MRDQKDRKITEIIGETIIGWNNDFDLVLQISGGDEHTGILLSDFSISKGGKELFRSQKMEPGQKVPAQLVGLVGAKISEACASSRGDLILSFMDGRQLVAPFSQDVEAWELRWLNKKQIISLPGGGFDEF